VRSRDRDAEFTEFVVAHRQRLLRAAQWLTVGDRAHAEDLVQTALTKAYVAWPKVRRADDPLRYTQRILTNAFVDDTRRAYRGRELPLYETDWDESAVDAPDSSVRTVVLRALAGLAPQQRAVVVLRHWLDYDVATTAATLGCTPGTVKSTNSRALAHLREALAPLTDDLTLRSPS